MTTASTASNRPSVQHVASPLKTMLNLCHVIVVYVLVVTLFVLLFVVHYSHRQHIDQIRKDVDQLQALVCRQSSAIYNCDEVLLRQHNVNSSRSDGDVGSAALLRSDRKRRNDASTSSSSSVNVEDDDQAAAGSGELTDRGDVMMNVISKIPVPVLKEVCTAALETCSLQTRPGPPGMPGPQGMPGQPGPPGEVGLPGLPGPQGILGEKGDSGMNGTAGEPGPPGAPGQNGTKGEKGEQGLTGEPGPMGNCSESPFTDAMLSGLKGEKGERGVDGVKGDKGDEGLHGLPGVEGPPGYNGTDGQRGRRGQKGVPGPIGLRGLKGDKGDVGDKGERGAAGPAASGGSLTRSASDNATGPFYGMRGLPGPPGLPGMKGSKGDPGYSCGCDMTTEVPTTETPTTVEPTIEPRLTDCRIQKIGTPVYQNSTTVNFGMWLRDSAPSSPMRYRYWITRHFTGRQLYGYEGLEQLKKNQPFVVYELDKLYFGTGNVVYNGAFYYHWAGNNRVLKYDLMINSTVANVTIDNAAYQNKGLYSTDYNYFDLAVDDNGLWVVYVVGSDPDALRVAKLDLVDLTIQKKWRVEVRNHTYGNGFVVCGILYLVKDIHANVTAIDFAYDLYENKPITDINLPFRNPYGMNNMIAYNHVERKIYSWDHQNLLIYPLLT